MIPPNEAPQNGWNEWARYVLQTLEDLKKQNNSCDDKMDANKEQMSKDISDNRDQLSKDISKLYTAIKILETKMTIRAATSGALASAIPVAIGLMIWFITRTPPV